MHSIRRTLRGQFVLSKTQGSHTVLLRARFTTLWRSEIHINLKIDALNRRWRRFCVRRTVSIAYLSRTVKAITERNNFVWSFHVVPLQNVRRGWMPCSTRFVTKFRFSSSG
jgi:hypothetical protein